MTDVWHLLDPTAATVVEAAAATVPVDELAAESMEPAVATAAVAEPGAGLEEPAAATVALAALRAGSEEPAAATAAVAEPGAKLEEPVAATTAVAVTQLAPCALMSSPAALPRLSGSSCSARSHRSRSPVSEPAETLPPPFTCTDAIAGLNWRMSFIERIHFEDREELQRLRRQVQSLRTEVQQWRSGRRTGK